MDKATYAVEVVRDGRWWVFEIPELGTGGQAMSLAEVEHEAQGVAAMWLDVPPESVSVDVSVRTPESVLAEWRQAALDEEQARAAQVQAAARRRAAVDALLEQGWTVIDTSYVLGISKQRVYQLSTVRDRERSSTPRRRAAG
ncbi:antitoxin HicB [Sanguibacter sp. 4.1]|uniref:Antitoxin HicB n=1 Tax=Sanguibacter biliveldensis TaxID=3030830 RepID=A0AAF0Z3J3_9MICO|nr:antitoxin HicB [Sanguibacter sp. 4.1]WPF82615.1 antitoxin HicB [Sanguibacter sp. 4.1]